MRKITVLLLAIALCCTLFACSGKGAPVVECDHEEYEDLLEMLEDGDYEAAHDFLYELEGVDAEAPEKEPALEIPPEEIEAPQEEIPAEPDTSGLLAYVEIITEDNLGNRNDSTEEFWTYDSYGRILETDSVELQEYYGYEFGTFVPHFLMEYGENDTVVKITVKEHDNVTAILTPEYDESGNLIHNHIMTNTGEFDVYFTYDDQGKRLTGERFDSWYQSIEYYTYTYDEAGQLMYKSHEEETPWEYSTVTEYTYDDTGLLIAATDRWTREVWGDNGYEYVTTQTFYAYSYSDNGKLLSILVTTDAEDSNYAQKEVIYHYE